MTLWKDISNVRVLFYSIDQQSNSEVKTVILNC